MKANMTTMHINPRRICHFLEFPIPAFLILLGIIRLPVSDPCLVFVVEHHFFGLSYNRFPVVRPVWLIQPFFWTRWTRPCPASSYWSSRPPSSQYQSSRIRFCQGWHCSLRQRQGAGRVGPCQSKIWTWSSASDDFHVLDTATSSSLSVYFVGLQFIRL